MNLPDRDRELHAFLYFSEEEALVSDGPLSGKTVALKDNLCVKGWPTTAGSRILKNFVPPYTADRKSVV